MAMVRVNRKNIGSDSCPCGVHPASSESKAATEVISKKGVQRNTKVLDKPGSCSGLEVVVWGNEGSKPHFQRLLLGPFFRIEVRIVDVT